MDFMDSKDKSMKIFSFWLSGEKKLSYNKQEKTQM